MVHNKEWSTCGLGEMRYHWSSPSFSPISNRHHMLTTHLTETWLNSMVSTLSGLKHPLYLHAWFSQPCGHAGLSVPLYCSARVADSPGDLALDHIYPPLSFEPIKNCKTNKDKLVMTVIIYLEGLPNCPICPICLNGTTSFSKWVDCSTSMAVWCLYSHWWHRAMWRWCVVMYYCLAKPGHPHMDHPR